MMRALPFLFLAAGVVAQAPIPTAPLRLVPPASAASDAPASRGETRAIDLVICLDVSGSMNGLINAARQNLWSIVNEMATLQPQPDLRVALLTYGNPTYGGESGFVAVQTPLTTDLDLVSQKLFALSTNGGDEYVARVIGRALDELEWSGDPMALKLLFVAGNEPATQDPQLDAFETAARAIASGVLVNTIYCGSQQKSEAQAWRDVAKRADGKFAAIEQDDAVVITTPFDEQLGALSADLNGTYVYYGKQARQWAANQVAQDSNASTLNSAASATRCMTKASSLYFNPSYDLVDACKQTSFSLATLKPEDLPESLRKLTAEQLKAHVDAKGKQRAALQKQVAELAKKRDAYVAAERKKLADGGDKLFEEAMLESVRAQAGARGFKPRPTEAVEPAEAGEGAGEEGDVDARFVEVVEQAASRYRGFVRVTGQPKMAPTMCRIPGPFAHTSRADAEHGGKLYLLYARNAEGGQYLRDGEPARVGQTLVKESWQRVKGAQHGATEATKRYPLGLTMKDGDHTYHAGDAYGLFVMHRLAKDTPGTDEGWVYGTVDKAGRVTAAGRVASCIKCHEDADNDRRFGLQ